MEKWFDNRIKLKFLVKTYLEDIFIRIDKRFNTNYFPPI